MLNLVGSVFFGVSAIGACVNPDTGDVTNLRWDNGGTFAGALCFLIAAAMLVPEARLAQHHAPSGDEATDLRRLLRRVPSCLMATEISIVPANQASWSELETVVGRMRCHGVPVLLPAIQDGLERLADHRRRGAGPPAPRAN